MSFTFTTSRFPLCSRLCALAALVLLAIPGTAQGQAVLTGLTLTDNQGTDVNIGTFAAGTTAYTATVAYSVVYVTVAATSADQVHILNTDSNMTLSGHQVALNRGGQTTINVEARASGQTTTRYTITVTSTPASTDAKLDGLALSAGTLTPTFDEDEDSYTALVARNVSTITVTPTLPAGASVSYNPADTTPSTPALDTPLKDGKNTITVTVTAEDGRTKETYTITVTRPGPDFDDATLSALRLSHGTLSPTFSSATTTYTASVGNGVRNLTVFATPTASGATARIGTDEISSGGLITILTIGENAITVQVTAEDGSTTQDYTITVTRADVSDKDASLGSLSLSPGPFHRPLTKQRPRTRLLCLMRRRLSRSSPRPRPRGPPSPTRHPPIPTRTRMGIRSPSMSGQTPSPFRSLPKTETPQGRPTPSPSPVGPRRPRIRRLGL